MVNAVLVSDGAAPVNGSLQALLRKHASLEDYGITVRALEGPHAIAVDSASGLLDAQRSAAAERAAAQTGSSVHPVMTYLANSMRSGDREVPYSLVAAVDLRSIAPSVNVDTTPAPIVLNDWAARDLQVAVGAPLTLEYYVWQDPGRLETQHAEFRVAAIVPVAGATADRDLTPVYPGITEADSLGDWDPPFPIDLKRVRPKDEEYWKQYRTTPKAFIPFEAGRRLWQSRYGDRTSVRVTPAAGESLAAARDRYATALRASLDPMAAGFSVRSARAEGLAASQGSTDFGEYFVYFSFFLVASALVLASLFFRLGVEQRAREVGLLRAVGFTTPRVRRLLTAEALALAAAGSVLGIAGAIGYGAAMMAGLRTWWSGAVGTRMLTLHVSPISLIAGAAGAMVAATVCIWWTLRGLTRLSERSLLAGEIVSTAPVVTRTRRWLTPIAGAVVFAALGAALVVAAAGKVMDPAAAFFGAGASVLIACLCGIAARLRGRRAHVVTSQGWGPVARLGVRNTAERPSRSVLAIAVIAAATFILISVDAFRRGTVDPTDRRSGTGGYPLLVDLMLPLVYDPSSSEGREALGIADTASGPAIEPFRVLPGDETSCLNLYQPTSPRILGVSRRFIEAGRFAFQASLAANDAQRGNPWTLLESALPDGAVPIIADANSLTYVLHKKLGDDIVIAHGDRTVRLRLMAALSDSVFQGELLMSDAQFIRLFPEQQGYRFLLIDVPLDRAAPVSAAIENGASDLGADAMPTSERLAEFHAVENTYLSTFQTLGGLGLLVGTLGLAAILLRNVLERRRELALLRAVGFGRLHLFVIVLAENAVLLGWGLIAGAASALVAIAPAAAERGARVPISVNGSLLLLAVLAAGLVSSIVATRAALRAPLVAALRSE
jgi:ABC-type antimicrobial peptide transport system permease subunit